MTDPTSISVPPAPSKPDLALVMRELADICAGPDGFTIADIHDRLGERSWLLILVLFSVPFVSPIPTLGLSVPFGIGAALIGAAIACGIQPRLPQRLLRWRCAPGLAARIVGAIVRTVGRLGRWVRPRWGWVVGRVGRRLAGVVVAISGALMALPLPIPFSNALPAWAMVLTTMGLLQRDGLVALLGHLVFAATLAFFALIAWGVLVGTQALLE